MLLGIGICADARTAEPQPAPEPAVPVAADAAAVPAADWIRGGLNTNLPAWGLHGGLRWGLPAGRGRSDGPHGLIRVRYPVLAGGEYDLINFVAIEPVVGHWRDDLHVAVNGRDTYWLSRQPIPGGIAFENFELRERFYDGQRFVFGITRKTPDELGLAAAGSEDGT